MSAADDLDVAYWRQARERIQDMTQGNHGRALVLSSFESLGLRIATWNDAQGFWQSENKGEKYALMHSELSEGFEGVRKPGPSDKIPEFTIEEEELADCMVRIFDYAGHFNLRLGLAFLAKLEYNLSRPYKHGKTC